MKILQLRECTGFYGAENVILELSKELQRQGLPVVIGILIPNKSKNEIFVNQAKSNGILIQVFPCRRFIDVKVIYKIRKMIKQNGITHIQSHGYKSNLYALLASCLKKRFLIATCHPWAESDYSFMARLYEKFDLFWLNRFNRIVAISNEVKEKILSSGLPKEKVSIIENGIDLSRFNGSLNRDRNRKKFGIMNDSLVIGAVGRLSVEKGYAILIDVTKELIRDFPKLYLLIIGDGPLKQILKQKTLRNDLNQYIKFVGESDDIPLMLSLMDIFVLPSLGEGLPMSLLEAMAAKLPVIASSVGDIPKIISHNQNGLLVPSNNKVALKNAISTLLRDQQKRQVIANSGYLTVSQKFSAQKMVKKYIELYKLECTF